jgi:hypothetical protein
LTKSSRRIETVASPTEMPDLAQVVRDFLVALLEAGVTQSQEQLAPLVVHVDVALGSQDDPRRLGPGGFLDQRHVFQLVAVFRTDEDLAPREFVDHLVGHE